MLNSAIKSYLKNPADIIKNISWRLTSTVSNKRHIFVVGAPRSGTTLLQVLLTAHDQLGGTMGETGTFTKQNLFDMNRQHGRLDEQIIYEILDNSTNIVNFFDNLSDRILDKYKGEIFVEKTPQHILKLKFLLKHFPNSDFIHIHRDGRDCYCSAKHNKNIPQYTTIEKYAKYWKKCIRSRAKISDARILDVSYEKLTTNTEIELVRIMQHLRLEFSPKQIDHNNYSKDIRSSQKAFSKLSSPIDNKSTGRWKKELSEKDNIVFLKIAGEELRRYCYTTNTDV